MTNDETEKPDLLYGAGEIAKFLGFPTAKACRHRIEAGEIPTFKIGGRVCALRSTLRGWLREQQEKAR